MLSVSNQSEINLEEEEEEIDIVNCEPENQPFQNNSHPTNGTYVGGNLHRTDLINLKIFKRVQNENIHVFPPFLPTRPPLLHNRVGEGLSPTFHPYSRYLNDIRPHFGQIPSSSQIKHLADSLPDCSSRYVHQTIIDPTSNTFKDRKKRVPESYLPVNPETENLFIDRNQYSPREYDPGKPPTFFPENHHKIIEEVSDWKRTASVQLLQLDLWNQFHELKTEMIITKNGRRMFPVVKVRIEGLKAEDLYAVFLDIKALDNKRYRYVYQSSQWVVAGTGEYMSDNNPYMHPESPARGHFWNNSPVIAFDKLKLTNNRIAPTPGQICLHSMQKYRADIWIQRIDENIDITNINLDKSKASKWTFEETEFITVTAYQNQKITKLKIDSNPFAKGFRNCPKQHLDNLPRHATALMRPNIQLYNQCTPPDINNQFLLHHLNPPFVPHSNVRPSFLPSPNFIPSIFFNNLNSRNHISPFNSIIPIPRPHVSAYVPLSYEHLNIQPARNIPLDLSKK